jgi:serpin B
VKVDEKGTEAAGATAGGGSLTAIEKPKIFRADHPFIFVIQDKKTGNILFLGRVANPSS